MSQQLSRLRGLRRTVPLATLAVGLALLAAACGGEAPASPGVASLGDTPSPSASAASNDNKASGLAYAQCMRDNGVKEFPDPSGDGKLTLKAEKGSGLDPNSPTFKAASEKCKDLRPEPPAAEKEKMRQNALEYAQCMRENGIEEFPDPNADGGMMLRMKKGSEMDPQSPQFKAAEEACKDLRPGGKGSPGEMSEGGGK